MMEAALFFIFLYVILLAALYNAPVTMSAYYQARVNHDMYGSMEGGKASEGQGIDHSYY